MTRLAGTKTGAGSASGRTALFLYVVLVVLPAAVFGGLLWRQLQKYQQSQLDELPLECRDAAERLAKACADAVEALRNTEMRRPFEHYAVSFFADDLGPVRPVRSPLISQRSPAGILGHFSFRVVDEPIDRDESLEINVLRGAQATEDNTVEATIEEIVREHLVAPLEDVPFAARDARSAALIEGYGDPRERLIRAVVLNFSTGNHQECIQALEDDAALRENVTHTVHVQYFELERFDRGRPHLPLLIASRRVTTDQIPEHQLPSCIDAINKGVLIVQGFVVDPQWLLRTMPRAEAARVLSPSQRLFYGSEDLFGSGDRAVEEVDVMASLGLAGTTPPLDGHRLFVVSDAGQLRRDFRTQNAWFASMAAILTVSMIIGIRLLLGSIRQSRTEAERTRNFVASVTHELRTPIAAVKLYGEMLRDGWVSDETRRSEYLGRIVTESDRLGGLVDRVLLRRRLFDHSDAPVLGNLNAEILSLRHDLELVGGRAIRDVVFELAGDLPRVQLLPDGVHVVLQNLVENARKYAPVELLPDGSPSGEPIVVRTRRSRKGRVLLEVLDRGPGIPEKDRSRIFEAFLRLGNEETRSTQGTGLGLHLVSLQARAMRARVRALPREGGGTIFQVAFST